jgi:hypothetical protein
MAPLANGTALEDMFLVKILEAAGANAELWLTRVAMKAMEVFMMDECVLCVGFLDLRSYLLHSKRFLSLRSSLSLFFFSHHPRPPPMMTPLMLISILLLPIAVTAASFSLSDRPTLKYGTAWKKEATADLVYRAVLNGFRHIDTACQPRHYNEAGVGEGWTKAAETLGLNRGDIWLQTKFSSLDAQDPDNTPYDRNAPLEDRVRVSFS